MTCCTSWDFTHSALWSCIILTSCHQLLCSNTLFKFWMKLKMRPWNFYLQNSSISVIYINKERVSICSWRISKSLCTFRQSLSWCVMTMLNLRLTKLFFLYTGYVITLCHNFRELLLRSSWMQNVVPTWIGFSVDRLCGLVVKSSWLHNQRSRVRFPELLDFLRSSGSRTWSTQPREDNWGATWIEK
jgi:hypothetical protein